jgi:Xaa-Pro dipeptidase
VGPTDRVLKPGDLIRLEIFGVIGGYHAGVCRTAVVGEPSEEGRRIYTTLVDCRRAVLEVLRPGASATDVHRRYLEVFGTLGYEPIPFVGHGIGLHLHEAPYLGGGEDARVEAGMAFGVEPLLYGPDFGLQFKDMVAVGPEVAEVLSDVTPVETLPEVPA